MYDCLKGIEPVRVMELFGALCQIPHGSKNEKEISDFIRDFCMARGLSTYQDEAHNLIIKKSATPGYEKAPVTVLQAHLDMVCEKEAGSSHDFEKDPIAVERDGDRIYARGTTLGADDATGVAFAMAVLESADLPHPSLEVVLTADEEAGMSGIKALDFDRILGRVIINLDCSDVGIVVGCAGPFLAGLSLDMDRESLEETEFGCKIKVGGLKGGHSGLDIIKERGNANLLLARMLSVLYSSYGIRLVSFDGGSQTNAICRDAEAVVTFPRDLGEEMEQVAKTWQAIFARELKASDPGVSVSAETWKAGKTAFTKDGTRHLLDCLLASDHGLMNLNAEVPGVPETSANLGVVHAGEDGAGWFLLYRSGLASKKEYVKDRCERMARLMGAKFTVLSSSPGWEYRSDSRLSQLIQKVYEEKYHEKLVVEISHGGNECGSFFEKFPDADIVCTGTQILGAHTPRETVLVSVIQKEWEMLCATLERMSEWT